MNDDFAASFTNVYERKTYILGLTSAFNAEIMPPSMQTHLLKIIQQTISMLNKLKEQEAKALQKAAKKEIKADNSSEDEDDDDDDDDEGDYEDDDEMLEDEAGVHSDAGEGHEGATGGGGPGEKAKNVAAADDEEEEEKGGDAGNGGLGFVDNDEDIEGGSEEEGDEDEEEELDEAFDLNVTMDMLNAPFKKTDEFGFFNTQFRHLYDRDMAYINNLVA